MDQQNVQSSALRQKGTYTITSVSFLLFILGLSSVFATQLTVNEQRISTNAFHILAAKQNAESAKAEILSTLQWKDIKHLSQGAKVNRTIDEFSNPSGNTQGRSTIELERLEHSKFQLSIMAQSANGGSSYQLQQTIGFQSLLHNIPQQALITTKEVNLSSASAVSDSDENSLLVWSGRTVDMSLDSEKIKSNDTRLDLIGKEKLVRNFLSADIDFLKTNYSANDCAQSDCTTAKLGNANIIYVDGDLQVNQNIGSASDPVILIIDGELDLVDNATVHGLVILLRDWNNNLQFGSILGSLIVDGKVDIEGVIALEHRQDILDLVQKDIGYLYSVAGAWHDF